MFAGLRFRESFENYHSCGVQHCRCGKSRDRFGLADLDGSLPFQISNLRCLAADLKIVADLEKVDYPVLGVANDLARRCRVGAILAATSFQA